MPKLFKFLKNERGVLHLIPLFLILIGIIAGVYLVQHPQIFKPKATSQNVEFLPGDCLTSQDGFGVLKCSSVQIRFTSPIDTNQTTDAGFSLVKTAYAYHPGGTEDYYCQTNQVGHSEKTPYGHNDHWDNCNRKNQVCVWLDKDNWGKSTDNGEPFNNDAECVDKPVCQNGRLITTDSKGGRHDLGSCDIPLPAQCTNDTDCADGNPCTNDYCLGSGSPGSLCVHNALSEGTVCQRDGTTFQPIKYCNNNGKCELNEPLPKSCTNDIGCTDGNACTEDKCTDGKCVNSNKPAGSVCQYNPTTYQPVKYCSDVGKCEVETPPTTQPRATAAPAPGVPPRGGSAADKPAAPQPSCSGTTGPADKVTAAQANCVLNIRSDVLDFYKNNGWCSGEIDKPGIVNNWYNKLANAKDKDQVKNCFQGGGGTGDAGCKNDGPAGNVTPAQAKCVLDKADILPFYQKNNWCVDESNYPKIVNNWMSINSQADKDKVKSCTENRCLGFPQGPGCQDGQATKTTTRFRFSEDPALLTSADWIVYTNANRTQNYTFKDPTPDGKPRFIYAEFEIVTKDAQGNVTKTEVVQASPFPYSIKFIKTETSGNGACPVTASCCASNQQKCGPDVAGNKFDGVSKDTSCPTGFQWCYSGYCISENYDGKGTTGSCPGSTNNGGNTGGPLTANCSVSITTVPVNQPVTYNASANGGSGGYKYSWAGEFLGNTQQITKTFTNPGFKTEAVVVGSGNESKSASCPAVNVVAEGSSELLCKQDCKKCKTETTCGYKTYDSCVDDKGNSKGSSSFCQNGAAKFRCYANANYNCASNQPNVYDYLCSACLDTGSNSDQ